ncbi:MAG: Trep_Strep domain-containing protein [Bacteroidales bacterium]|jgi:hypothetical protein|nr:Trep_Strep domain-containing protein [Bacteroidales bacterium]
MDKILKIGLLELAYLAIFILGGTSGLIHPMCYAYVGALLPLLFALVYLPTACTIQKFGAATVLNGFLLVLFWIAGEADLSLVVGLILLTAIAEVVRFVCGYTNIKGIRWSFIPFALSFFAYTAHWWTDTEGSLAAAVAEMPAGYDAMMKPVIDNTPALIAVILLAIPVAIVSMRIAEKLMEKQIEKLKK